MRADRLLSIMLLLQVNRRLTARVLAERLEVSERTIHRDMEVLSAAGIPVVAERGNGGGWSLLDEYRTDLTGLNKSEIQALFFSGPSRLLADLGLEKASDAALIKLLAALPSATRDEAEYARQRIYVDISSWNRPEEAIPLLPRIQEAIWQERKLKMTYKRGECESVERLVDPLGLVAKGSVWYLVAAVDGQTRSYRVARVEEAIVTDVPFVRPPDFDLASHWKESTVSFKESFPRYNAILRLAAADVQRLYYAGRFARVEHVGTPGPDGKVDVKMRFQFEEEARDYALGFGTRVEVIEPAGLRKLVIEMARNVISFYADSDGNTGNRSNG